MAAYLAPMTSKADVVYAYASYGTYTRNPFGFSLVIPGEPTFGPLVNADAAGCFMQNDLCSALGYKKIYDNSELIIINPVVKYSEGSEGLSGDKLIYASNEGNYVRSLSNLISSRQTLVNGDVLYTYTDTLGNFLTFVNSGFLNSSDEFRAFKNLACVEAFAACAFSGVEVKDNLGRFDFFSVTNQFATRSLPIPVAVLGNPGSYTFKSNGVNATLNVYAASISVPSGGETGPIDVPEPASLALLGLGAAGILAARRRKAA